MATVTPSGADPVHYTIAASKAFVGDLRLRVGSGLPPKAIQIHYPSPAPAGLTIDLLRLSGPAESHSLLTPLPPNHFTDLQTFVNSNTVGAVTTLICTFDSSSWVGPDEDIAWQVRVFANAPQTYELHQLQNNVGAGAVTIRRVMVDPNSAMTAPGAVLEKNNFTLAATAPLPMAGTVHITPDVAVFPDPVVSYRWTHSATIAIPPLHNVPSTDNSGPQPAPGVYGATVVTFTQRAYLDELVWPNLFADSPTQNLTINPRNFRMILLLDRSGSMLSNLGGGESKWAATVKAAHVWADLFVAFRNGVSAGDRVGIMIFEANACGWSGTVATPIQIAQPNGGAPGTPGVLSAIGTLDVNSATLTANLQAPGSCTPIGDALIQAMTELGTGVGVDDRNVLILMTDGYENSGTIVVDDDIALPAGALDTFAHARTSGIPGSISAGLQLYTIGVGSTVQASVLDELPNLADLMSPVPPPAPLTTYYRMANTTQELLPTFAQILGHSLEAQAIGPTYDAVAKTMTFPVSANEHRLAVVLQWASSADDLQVFCDSGAGFVQVYGPGVVVAPPAGSVTGKRRDTHGIVVIDLPLLGVAAAASTWRVHYVPNAGANDIDPAKFLVMVDLNVKAEFSFDRTRYLTGEPMVVSGRILSGGVPVTGAKVTVELARPGEGLGTFLATNAAGYQQPPPAGPDPTGGKAAMTAALLRKHEMQDLPVVTPAAIFSDGTRQLFDDGAHSDGKPNDGVYSNVYTAADREGTYTWRFYVEGSTPGGGKFTRLMTISKWVGVNVDPISTDVVVAPVTPTVKGMQAAQVAIRPVDRNGQFLGPFRPNLVKFKTSAGQFTGTVVSRPDGTYAQVLHYPPGKVPVVTVNVQGKDFTPVVAAPGCLGMIINAVRSLYQWLLRLGS